MRAQFEIAGGSVIGTDHRRELGEKNGQDSHVVRQGAFGTVCVVADGCSTVVRGDVPVPSHSEVGAEIGARLVAEAVGRHLLRWGERAAGPMTETIAKTLLARARLDVLASLRVLANQMGSSFAETVGECLLFTIVGIAISPWGTLAFSIGDGIVAINGEILVLGPFPGNQPPYLAYGLVETSLAADDPSALEFRIVRLLPTEELESFLIGSDGVADLIAAESRTLPGRTDVVGPLRQFWNEDAFFSNSDAVRRRLALANRGVVRADWTERRLEREHGLLPDDTTLVTGRRRRQGGIS